MQIECFLLQLTPFDIYSKVLKCISTLPHSNKRRVTEWC